MTVVEYASLGSKERKTLRYEGTGLKGKRKISKRNDNEAPEVHATIAVTTYLSLYIVIIIGYIRDFLRKLNLFKSAVKDVSSHAAHQGGGVGCVTLMCELATTYPLTCLYLMLIAFWFSLGHSK